MSRRQYSRAGIQSNLMFYQLNNDKTHRSVSPPRIHYTSPNERAQKIKNINNQLNKKQDDQIPSIAFSSVNREYLDQKDVKPIIGEKYNPKFSQIHKSPIKYSIAPIPEIQAKQRVYSPPQCILRGNTCDYLIRQKVKNMQKQTKTIQQLKEQLEKYEIQQHTSNKPQENDEDYKRKKYTENQGKLTSSLKFKAIEKRKIAEQMIEQEKEFQNDKFQYENMVDMDIQLQEIKILNLMPNDVSPPQFLANFSKTQPRKELFSKNNKVQDLTERTYNNYNNFSPKQAVDLRLDYFQKRKELFPKKEGLDDHSKSRDQYENLRFKKEPCFVNFNSRSRSAPKKKFTLNQVSNQDLILHRTKDIFYNKKVKGDLNFFQKIGREMPSSSQMRVVTTNQNFYEGWKSNSPYEVRNLDEEMLEQQAKYEQQI